MRVAIIGAGVMGQRIAAHFMAAGFAVGLIDPNSQALEIASDFMARTGQDRSRLTLAPALSDLAPDWRDTPLVIEAVPENLALKHRVLRDIEAAVSDQTIIASNTSGLMSRDLCAGMRHPERLVIAHFFNPADVIPVVEVIGGPQTPAATTARLADILRQSGKVPAVLKIEVPGFVANRIQHAMMRECFHLVETGVADAATIDAIVQHSLGVRLALIGPFLQRDLNGLDTHLNIASYLYPQLATDATPPAALRSLVDNGALGRKSGKGFYDWDSALNQRAEALEQALRQVIAIGATAPPNDKEA